MKENDLRPDYKIRVCRYCNCQTFDCDICGFCKWMKARFENVKKNGKTWENE